MDAIVATNNSHKLIEIREFLSGHFDNIFSLKDKNINIDIEETGKTFYENALIKAKAISELTNLPAIADDSGLCVNALNGEPGVYSARYAGDPCDDHKNNEKLLKELNKINSLDRSAYFISSIVLYYPNGDIVSGEGRVNGTIINEYRGNGGFGYDPLFLCTELNKTFGETSLQEKNLISHRARALKDLLVKLHSNE